jgi:hypothetical protein
MEAFRVVPNPDIEGNIAFAPGSCTHKHYTAIRRVHPTPVDEPARQGTRGGFGRHGPRPCPIGARSAQGSRSHGIQMEPLGRTWHPGRGVQRMQSVYSDHIPAAAWTRILAASLCLHSEHPRQGRNRGMQHRQRQNREVFPQLSSVKLWSQYASHRSSAAQASLTCMPCICTTHPGPQLAWQPLVAKLRVSLCWPSACRGRAHNNAVYTTSASAYTYTPST